MDHESLIQYQCLRCDVTFEAIFNGVCSPCLEELSAWVAWRQKVIQMILEKKWPRLFQTALPIIASNRRTLDDFGNKSSSSSSSNSPRTVSVKRLIDSSTSMILIKICSFSTLMFFTYLAITTVIVRASAVSVTVDTTVATRVPCFDSIPDYRHDRKTDWVRRNGCISQNSLICYVPSKGKQAWEARIDPTSQRTHLPGNPTIGTFRRGDLAEGAFRSEIRESCCCYVPTRTLWSSPDCDW